jgi:hypothetical protein
MVLGWLSSRWWLQQQPDVTEFFDLLAGLGFGASPEVGVGV